MDQEGPSWAHPLPTAVRVDLPCLGPRPCLCTFPPGRRDTAPPHHLGPHRCLVPEWRLSDLDPLSQVSFCVSAGDGGTDTVWLNVFLSSLSVWVSVCMTWNKLPTASPPVYLQCPSLDLHRPVPSCVPCTAQLTTRGCHTLSTHPAGEQPPAHHHPTHCPWPRTQPPACLSAPPLRCPVAALGPSPLSWGTATLAPLVIWRALSREERREEMVLGAHLTQTMFLGPSPKKPNPALPGALGGHWTRAKGRTVQDPRGAEAPTL